MVHERCYNPLILKLYFYFQHIGLLIILYTLKLQILRLFLVPSLKMKSIAIQPGNALKSWDLKKPKKQL